MATAIMKQKEVPEMDDVAEIISKISEDSPYKRRPTQKRTWMTVPEMGKLLGLKKTDRYWLVHKNVFESKEIAGKIRINIASFEKWYANQIKYHKVTGEKPGKELKSWSYSVKEVADLLGVDEYLVYDLLKKNQMEAVIVDYWKRIPKESFQNWYKSQSQYRTKEDRKKDALLELSLIHILPSTASPAWKRPASCARARASTPMKSSRACSPSLLRTPAGPTPWAAPWPSRRA